MLETIRTVRLFPYRKGHGPSFTLRLLDPCIFGNRPRLAYTLTQHENGKSTVLFEGSDFGPSPMHAVDSDETVAALLGFLTLRPGDTDAEYFENYTDDQRTFCDQHAETLACYCMDRFGES